MLGTGDNWFWLVIALFVPSLHGSLSMKTTVVIINIFVRVGITIKWYINRYILYCDLASKFNLFMFTCLDFLYKTTISSLCIHFRVLWFCKGDLQFNVYFVLIKKPNYDEKYVYSHVHVIICIQFEYLEYCHYWTRIIIETKWVERILPLMSK